MPIRNPFARRPGGVPAATNDENSRPGSSSNTADLDPAHPGFERVNTVGSKASSALSIRTAKSEDNGEYKMSVVNDSGVYLPPSPTEKEATWPRRYLSRTSTDTRSSSGMGEIEHFSISRESFDSYRRSFDICAKSPVVITDSLPPRQSLDSAHFPRLPRSALPERRFEREPPTPEEGFEDVGLNDESANTKDGLGAKPTTRRRGFFKFGSEHVAADGASGSAAATGGGGMMAGTSMSRFLPGRKRAQSGQGSELGAMPIERPGTANAVVVPIVAVVAEQEVQS